MKELAQIFSSRFANLFRQRARARKQFGNPARQLFRFEPLESRLLLSADPIGANAGAQLYVLDGSISHQAGVLDSLSGCNSLVLDRERDGIEQIAQALAGRSGVTAVHVISHGASGSVTLGSTTLTAENLGTYEGQLNALADALTADADILFYGCNVAAGESGAGFVEELGRLTGADIAASTDLTGSADLGGDWDLEYATGSIDAAAFASDASLLLSAVAFAEFFDPNPASGNQFGATVVELSSGNVVVTSPGDDAGGTDAGAVYLFNGQTGALISTLTGSSENDRVGAGIGGIILLGNGNYLVHSVNWDNGAAVDAGAVTFGSGTAGVSGVVSAANSLVGSTSGDQIGNGGITLLSTGNYVVRSASWDNGAAVNAGAVTFGSGTTGASGVVSEANSLVGTMANDAVGLNGVNLLSNGNYLVRSANWDNGAAVNAGAVTFGSGTTGVSGVVSAANSLVGGTTNDAVGSNQLTFLSNGNYLVRTTGWNNAEATAAGAVTLGSSTTGVSGVISAANSLVGTTANDAVGSGISLLANGNYLVRSATWDNGLVVNAGAVTFGSGTTGVSGVVSEANSLVGTTASDQVGNAGIIELGTGNYLVNSANWDNGAAADAGAVTFGSGTTGVSGAVSGANSLVGATANDRVGDGGFVVLSNGHYVVRSLLWDNGAAVDAGAVTFGSGTAGVSGVVSAVNSLVGSTSGDQIGNGGITLLSTGNYVVRSTSWDNGLATNAGAVTFGSGTTGVSGVVGAANSLVGGTTGDAVGNGGITLLSTGNYVVRSASWDNGAAVNAGAVTFGSGTTGASGVVSAANSLVGGTTGDAVGSAAITLLSAGNYVVRTTNWNNAGATAAGAVTFGSGTTGVSGVVSEANSLVGTTASDQVGNAGIIELSTGNYLVNSANWDNGAAADAGAVTFGSGTTGVSGAVSGANSLVGSSLGDQVGSGGILLLSSGNYVVRSLFWDNGAAANAGAVTFGSGMAGVSGVVSAVNSLVGGAANDQLGSGGITLLSTGNYVVSSPLWNNGAAIDAGAVTFGSGTTGVSGVVSVANSLVGDKATDRVGSSGITVLSTGNYVVTSEFWNNGVGTAGLSAGAVTFGSGTTGVSGVVSAGNSLVGTSFGDRVGFGGITRLNTGNYLVRSPLWENQGVESAGALTFGSGTTGVSGVVSAANSLVGSSSGDEVGSGEITLLNTGNYLVRSLLWDNGSTAANAGAVTFGSGTAGVSGMVSAANSLVGTTANDQVGSGGITPLSTGNYVVRSAGWDNGSAADAGAVTFGSGTTGVSGAINSGNSAIGLAPATSLQPVGVGNVNGIFFGRFLTEGGGRIRVGSQGDGFPNTVNLSVSAAAGSEAGTTAITVTASAEKTVFGNQTIGLGVSGANITAGDYTLSNSAITILDGQTTGSVTFTVTDDTLLEATETATLSISGLSAGLILGATTTHDVVIADNENATLSIAPTSLVTEAGGAQIVGLVTLTITGTGSGTFALGSGISLTADVTDAGGGTAVSGTDYTAFGTQAVTFDDGALSGATRGALLAGIVDGIVEEDETVHLSLGNLGGSAVAKSLGNTASITTITSGSVFVDDGHLFVIDVSAAGRSDTLVITSDTANSRYVIADTNAANVLFAGAGATQVDATTVYVPFSAVTGDIHVDTLGGDDSLTVDFSLGNFSRTIAYDGGVQTSTPGDSLSLAGSIFDTGTFTFANNSEGTIDLAGTSLISYIGLEPIVATGLTIDNVIFAFDGGAEAITLTGAAGAAMTIDSTLGESVTFSNPASSLTIDAGTGDDQVTIVSVDAAFDLTINGGQGHDTIHLNGDVTFTAGNDFDVDADTINVGPDANLILAGAGAATLQASGSIALASGSRITTVDGDITLSANRQATPTDGNFAGVTLDAGAVVAALGTGDVTVRGTGGRSAGDGNFGVHVLGAGAQITANGGAVLVEGAGGGAGTSSANYGVYVAPGGVITNAGTGAGATVTVSGTGGNSDGTGGSHNFGVHVTGTNAQITASGGAVRVEGAGGGGGASSNNHGVHVTSGGVITNTGPGAEATVTVTGTGGNSGGDHNHGVDVAAGGLITNANGGAVLVEGTGGGGGASGFTFNFGVAVLDGGVITNMGTDAGATVTVRGTGGNSGGSNNHGVLVENSVIDVTDGEITANGGALLVEGFGGGANSNNHGVLVNGYITNTGTGTGATVTVRATGGDGAGDNNDGVVVNSQITAHGGAVLVEGTGGGAETQTSGGNFGVDVHGFITNSGTGTGATVTVRGTGGNGGGDNNSGVALNISFIQTGAGAVLVEGFGGGAGTSSNNRGVLVSESDIRSAEATVTVRGTGGNSGGDNNHGVEALASNRMQGVAVLLEGSGGGAGTSSSNHGVWVSGVFRVNEWTDAGATLTVRGTGGNSGGDNNSGVVVTGFILTSKATVDSGGTVTLSNVTPSGAVLLEGTGGGAGTSSNNHGVVVSDRGFSESLTGTGIAVTVRGIAGNRAGTGGSDNHGVVVSGVGTQITASGSAVLVQGTGGGTGDGSENHGVFVLNGGAIANAGTGAGATVTVSGTGGNGAGTGDANYGVWVSDPGARITSSGGAISITGESGSGAASPAILIDGGGQVIGTAGVSPVTLIGDSMDFQSTLSINAGANAVVLRPRTAGTLVDLGGADVLLGSPLTLGLTDAELDRVAAGVLRIGSASAGAITVTNAIDLTDAPTVPVLHLITGAAIVDANAIGNDLTVSSLALKAVGGMGSSNPLETDVDALAAANGAGGAGGSIQIINAGALSIAQVDGVTGIFSNNAEVNLNVGSLSIDEQLNSGSGDVRIVAATTVTQSANGVITADELGILAGGNVTLAAAVNDVNTLAVNTIGLVEFRDSDDLAISVVVAGGGAGFTGATGIVSNGGDVNLNVGILSIILGINAGSGDARLVTGTTMTQGESGVITADELGIRAGGAVTLAAAANDVNTLAVSTSGLVEFRDGDDLTIGVVAAGGGANFTGAAGIVSNHGDVSLQTGASLVINQALNAGTADVRLVSGRGVTQGASGAITADELGIRAEGAMRLAAAANDVNTLAVETFGSLIEFRDSDDLTVGTVLAGGSAGFIANTVGIVSSDSDINLNGGSLSVNQELNAGIAGVRLVSGATVVQGPDGIITADELGILAGADVLLDFTNNDVNTLAVATSGVVGFHDFDDLSIGTVAAGGNAGFTGAVGILSNGGDVNLSAKALIIHQALNAGAADARLVVDGEGSATFVPVVAQGIAGVITADELGILAGADVQVRLAAVGNDVNTLAMTTTRLIEFRDSDDLTIGTVAAGGSGGFTGAVGLLSNGGNVNLNSGTSLAINQQLNAGTADVRVVSGTSVTQGAAGVITADELGILAGGNVALAAAANDVNTLAGATTGPVEFNDADNLIIGTVAAGGNAGFTGAAGINTGGNNLNLAVGGVLTVTSGLDSGTHDMSLTAPGGVSFTGSAVVNVDLGAPDEFTTITISNGISGGAVTLDGTLNVAALFAPTANNSFQFMTFGSRGGSSFATTNLPDDFVIRDTTDPVGLELVFAPQAAPSISINDVSLLEGNSGVTSFVFTASLSNPSSQTVTVNFATADGTATLAGNDYAPAAGSVTFAPGQTSNTVSVLVNGDVLFEPDEAFTVNLSGASNATIADGTGLGTIRNDDNQPTISINDVTLLEGNSGLTNYIFSVSLSNPSSETVTVNYSTADGTATVAGNDYSNASGSVIFAPGQTSQTVSVTVNGDVLFEAAETFAVNLDTALNATIADGTGLGTIRNDDNRPAISINDVTLLEGHSGVTSFIFTASLSNPSSETVTVNYSTADGTATLAGGDYAAASGLVVFAPGQTSQTIGVTVNGDVLFEAAETFAVNLSAALNATIADGTGIGTIVNDDAATGGIDLVVGAVNWDPDDLLVPGDHEHVSVVVSNIGDTAVHGQVKVKIYGSTDTVFDASDVFLDDGHTGSNIQPGGSKSAQLNFKFPNTLLPGEYFLLAVVDPANEIAESNEANNSAIGESFDFHWMFGNVPGHGHETLTVRDADGTWVNFSLLGPGTGEITIDDEGDWDLVVTGTTGNSILSILALGGGDHRVELDDIHVTGALRGLLAPKMGLTGALAIDGALGAGMVIGSATDAVIAVQTILGTALFGLGVQGIAILGDLENSEILIGADADTDSAGDLGDLLITGSMISSCVRVGQDPVDGIFDNGDDVLLGGSIDSITILGEMTDDSCFVASDLPRDARIEGERVDTETDPRFWDSLPVELEGAGVVECDIDWNAPASRWWGAGRSPFGGSGRSNFCDFR